MESDLSQQTSKYTEGESFQSHFTTDITSDSLNTETSQSSAQESRKAKENIKLIPIKVKDLEALFQNIPQYQGKTPVKLNIKENDIDEVIEQQRYTNSATPAFLQSHRQNIQVSPISVRHLEDYVLNRRSHDETTTSQHARTSFTEQTSTSAHKLSRDDKLHRTRPLLGADQAQQIYAMTDVQAFPMIGETRGFRADRQRVTKAPRRRKVKKSRTPRSRSRYYRSRTRSPRRVKSRGRSRRRSPKRRQGKTPIKRQKVIVRRRSPSYHLDPTFCTQYPMCGDYCTHTYAMGPQEYNRPLLMESRRPGYSQTLIKKPLVRESRVQISCDCNLCEEKLQFIQPGVCSRRKDMWTNEYAVLPKPQINFIDPCKGLDPAIYPRADRPCIRDGRGNPLTDCIGRPLRDPVGKKFLNFSPNGSLLETNFRGNFYTGQPPLCVKCPLPTTSCAPDTTHNWWMSCGYPVKANMGPFLNRVLAAEHLNKRY